MGLPQLDVHLGKKMSPKSIKDLHIRNKALAILQLKKKKKTTCNVWVRYCTKTSYPKNKKEIDKKTTNTSVEEWVRDVCEQAQLLEQINWPADLRKILMFISSQGNQSMNIDLWQEKK